MRWTPTDDENYANMESALRVVERWERDHRLSLGYGLRLAIARAIMRRELGAPDDVAAEIGHYNASTPRGHVHTPPTWRRMTAAEVASAADLRLLLPCPGRDHMRRMEQRELAAA